MSAGNDTAILLDIFQRLGSIEAKLEATIKSHDDLEKDVADLKALKQKFGGIILTLTLLWSLICAGFVYYADNIRQALHK